MNAYSASLNDLRIENQYLQDLPAQYFTRVQPMGASAPRLLGWSRDVAALIGLDGNVCQSPEFTALFSGNVLPTAMDPFAMNYGGHQFGHWAGQLGDGRAINLCEVRTIDGGHASLQLKGAGPTPYARRGDGFAVLRSSVREYLCSEAMHYLGVPTTRALCLISTGDKVLRDVLYDGHPKYEPGAVICRVAPSFVRFGHVELFAARGDKPGMEALLGHLLRRDFPELGPSSPQVYAQMFRLVCERTAQLMVNWQRVGFVHGVMNTDNMSILGLTLDYGPYGWLEPYDANWTPNTTDAQGRRYRYGQQPSIALWNLAQLARSLTLVIEDTEALEAALDHYQLTYTTAWNTACANKIGLPSFQPATDAKLMQDLWQILGRTETDMTLFFRNLAALPWTENQVAVDSALEVLQNAYYAPTEIDVDYRDAFDTWLQHYAQRLNAVGETVEIRQERMNAVNPKYVLRNYLAQVVIDELENGNTDGLHELQTVLEKPYLDQPGKEHFAQKRPEWARNKIGCSMLSCSS